MIRFTHFYDSLFKIVAIMVGAIVGAIVNDFLLTYASKDIKFLIGGIIFICSLVGVMYLFISKIGWVPTFLYIRFTLHAKVSPSEAKGLSFLFDGSLGKWYPLRWIRTLNPESRREALFKFASIVANGSTIDKD